MVEAVDIAQKLSGAGLATLLVLIILGSYKGIWVWGYQLQKAEADGQEWKRLAMQGIGMADKAVHIAKSQVP